MLGISPRWAVLIVFALYSALNYLDRQTLAALAPQLRKELQLNYEDIGWLHSAFYLTYAICSPFAGLFIDRVGLGRGATITIVLWSCAAMATGFAEGITGLLICRMLLGAAEAGGIPAFGKASATYLHPRERALGLSLNQLGLSLGIMAAPLFAGYIAAHYGWRAAFAAGGVIGLFWVPIWRIVSRRAVPLAIPPSSGVIATPVEMLKDPRLYGLIAGNILVMTVYSLWTNWTTEFLVKQFQMDALLINQRYAWISPVFATAGGVFGGWMALRWITSGATVMSARNRSILYGTLALSLATLAVPMMPNAALATAMVSLSFFCAVAVSTNVYALPQDLFGAGRTAFAVSAITCAYGIMSVIYSPVVGRLVDRYGFTPVCQLSAFLPLLGWLVLRMTTLRNPDRV